MIVVGKQLNHCATAALPGAVIPLPPSDPTGTCY